MLFNIVFTRHALKDLERIENNIKRSILSKIKLLKDNPQSISKKLINHSIGDFRLRVGDYRVIFDILGNDIVILKIGHRKNIYD